MLEVGEMSLVALRKMVIGPAALTFVTVFKNGIIET